eukprot:3766099-Alexandrium_andersonii.AAC.1
MAPPESLWGHPSSRKDERCILPVHDHPVGAGFACLLSVVIHVCPLLLGVQASWVATTTRSPDPLVKVGDVAPSPCSKVAAPARRAGQTTPFH